MHTVHCSGCLVGGGSSAWWRRGSAWGRCVCLGGCLGTEWPTDVKTLPCRNYVADGKNVSNHLLIQIAKHVLWLLGFEPYQIKFKSLSSRMNRLVPYDYTFRSPAGFHCGVTREKRPVAATAESYWALQGGQESVTTGLYFQERSISPSPWPDSWLLDDGRSIRSRIPSNPRGSRGLTHLRWICHDRISPIPHE